jgi:hypothetical protein
LPLIRWAIFKNPLCLKAEVLPNEQTAPS